MSHTVWRNGTVPCPIPHPTNNLASSRNQLPTESPVRRSSWLRLQARRHSISRAALRVRFTQRRQQAAEIPQARCQVRHFGGTAVDDVADVYRGHAIGALQAASVYEPLAAQCLLVLFTSSKLYCIANLTGNQKNFSHSTKLGVDLGANDRHNNRCCFNVRRYLSWIEGLTTNQYVGGSNPSRRTILTARLTMCAVTSAG